MIEAGTIVEIHGLKSASGQKINGKRGAVIKLVDDPEGKQRWLVRVQQENEANGLDALNGTVGIKEENLKPLPRLPLPTGPMRGIVLDVDDTSTRRLCQLLVCDKDGYRPSEIMFTGYAFMALDRMGQFNFTFFTADQMEQMGGVLALANICRIAEEPATEEVLFCLLEGDPMYVDVLMQQLYCTGLIVEEAVADDVDDSGFYGPPTALTPDQDSAPYVRTMSEGPVLLFGEMAKYDFAQALWAAMGKSEYYHLVIQRLLRLTAREAKGTRDGRKLGKSARRILTSMFPGITGLEKPVSEQIADHLLSHAGLRLSSPDKVTVEAVNKLLSLE